MSAVLDHAPEQLGIEGLAPATEPHAAMLVAGRLARRAVLRISTDGRPHLTVEIRQRNTAHCFNFVATYHGAVTEILQLEEMAHRFGIGTKVMVRGAGLEFCEFDHGRDEHHPEAHLRVIEVKALREIAFDNPAEGTLL